MVFNKINFQSIFEDMPNPVVLLHDQTPLRLNEAANTLCSQFKRMLDSSEESCASVNIYTFLGEEIEAFRKSGNTKTTIRKRFDSPDGVLYYDVAIKYVSNDKSLMLLEFTNTTEEEMLKKSIEELAKGVLSAVGDAFFESLVSHLVAASNADHAFICEFTDETETKVRTVAVCADGKIVPNIEFELETTPCKLVVTQGLQIFEKDIRQIFHLDHLARELGVDSYFGIPLIDSKGKVLGPMAIMGRKPLKDPAHAVAMLKLFAVRASAELERRQSDKRLQNNLHFLQSLMDSIPNPIFYRDISGRFLGCNSNLEKVLGKTKDDIIGKTLSEITDAEWCAQCARTDKQVLYNGHIAPYETMITTADGKEKNVIFTKAVFTDSDDNVNGVVGTILDITERKKAEQKIEKLAYYDTLTNLPNRQLLKDRISLLIQHAQRNNESFSVLFIDLDRFKDINDTLGHSAGDTLLTNVADMLKTHVRSCDTVARLGGDEFVIVLTNVEETAVSSIASKLLNMLSRPQYVNGHEVFTSLSIGISIFPNDGTDPETLLKNADVAMYQAKEQGRNNYQFFSSDMNYKVMNRLLLEKDLRHAVDKEEFFIEYQPQYNVRTGEMYGVEALLRWQQPQKGLIPPSRFIQLAEETGLILQIGEWVLLRSCFQNVEWAKKNNKNFTTSVNISAVQFKQKNFINTLKNIIKITGVNPENIELELTESVLMTNVNTTTAMLKSLKDLGLKLAIDDFGTGYSSLNYLRHFPIDRLKIDRSFVSNIKFNADNSAITKAIIAMAESLRMKVIAEGVESQDELDILKELNCFDIQGFLLSRPTSAENIGKLLNSSI